MSRISAHEHSILRVFSDDYAFCIPNYQRPYRWGVDQAEQLLKDISDSAREATPFIQKMGSALEQISPYFLGSIVLIKPMERPECFVVDGQQRLTTLSILIAALRATVDTEDSKVLSGLLFEKGSMIKGTKDRCRLTLRQRDHDFYQTHILMDANLVQLDGIALQSIPEAQENIARNALYFLGELRKMNPVDLSVLATYLLQHTFLVVVATESLESAFRIFSVLNDRGMDLTAADILKADIIGKIPSTAEDSYTRKWENTDEKLGSSDFDKLISHIVMIHNRQKMRETVLKTFRKVVKAEDRPIDFIDNELLPYAEAYQIIQKFDWDGENEKKINSTLRYLKRIDNNDWVPPALMLFVKYKGDSKKLSNALVNLERLAVVLWLNRATINDRIERYGKLIAEIATDTDLDNSSALQLTAKEIKNAVEVLSGDIYNLSPKPKRTMILLRLDELLGSGEASYEESRTTIEHVLPQTPPEKSQWLDWWSDEKVRAAATHRLGNLALLNGRQNSAAKNWDFAKKKNKYFTSKGGASPFLITNEVLKQAEWPPKVFSERQDRFQSKLYECWRLVLVTNE